MTRTIARLILAMLLLPCAIAVFVLGVAACLGHSQPPPMLALFGVWTVVYTFIFVYWVMLWRSSVRWTAARVWKTTLATAFSPAIGAAIGLICLALIRGLPSQIATMLGGGVVPIVWVLSSVLVWRETPQERMERMSRLVGSAALVCPICGYNLSGLREARCPECGASYTLDQLAASQPERQEHPAEL